MQADVVQQTSGGAVPLSASLPDLILLKGAPGVGKSTTAKLVAQHFPSGVRVEVDTLRQMVISVDWTNQAEHRSLLSLSAQLAAGFLRSGFVPVILVDTFSGDKIDGFLNAFRSESPLSRVLVAVLHASEGVLRERVRHRDADGFSNVDIALRINQDVVREVRSFELLLDSSDLAPADVAAAILKLARVFPVDRQQGASQRESAVSR